MSSIQNIKVGGTSYGIEANKLGSPASIDGVAFDGGDSIVHYAASSTGASTAAKAATIGNDFTLGTGARVTVKFTNANTASNPTLNVNSTGAKSIMAYGTTNAVTWDAGQAVEFVYDGTYWQMVSSGIGSATIRGRVKVDASPTNGSDNAVSSGGVYTGLSAKAPIASPTLTGTPKSPTPTAGDNSTKIATTAFVSGAVSALQIGEVNRRLLESFPTITSTGAVAMTEMGADGVPIKMFSTIVSLSQSGSGEPAPNNVRTISGVSAVAISQSDADTSNPSVSTIQIGHTSYGGELIYDGNWKMRDTWDYLLIDGTQDFMTDDERATTDTIVFYLIVNLAHVGDYTEFINYGNAIVASTMPTISVPAFYTTYQYEIDQKNIAIAGYRQATTGNNNFLYFSFNRAAYPGITDVESVKSWFQSNPTQVAFLTRTPVETAVTGVQITSLLGTNNIWTDSGTVSVTFRCDPSLFEAEQNRKALESFPTETSTGAVSETMNGANNIPPKSVEVTMLPIQNLNGYDNPWPGGGGVNKIDFSACTAGGEAYGLYSQMDGELIEVSGTCSSGGTKTWTIATVNNDQRALAATLSFAGFVTSATTPVGWPGQVSAVTYDSNSGKINVTVTNLVTNLDYIFHIGIVAYSGATPTAWSPYSNICNITGRTGANVYLEDEYDANADPFATFDWTSKAGTVYGATLSDNHNGTWTLTRNWEFAKAAPDGQLILGTSGAMINASGNTTNGGYAYYNTGEALKPFPTSLGNGLCNMLKTATISGTTTEAFFSYQTSGGTGRVGFRMEMLPGWNQGTGSQNGALFKTWVADQYAKGRVLQIAWRLVTPITYILPAKSVLSYLANNSFWSNVGDSTVVWRCDPTLFINSQVAALTALISGT